MGKRIEAALVRVSQLLSYGAPTPALISRDLRRAVSLCFCPDVKNKVVTHEAASTRLLGRQRGPVGAKWSLPAVMTLSQTAEMVPEAPVSGGLGSTGLPETPSAASEHKFFRERGRPSSRRQFRRSCLASPRAFRSRLRTDRIQPTSGLHSVG